MSFRRACGLMQIEMSSYYYRHRPRPDDNHGMPVFGIYGVREDGLPEHIVYVKSYRAARDLLAKLLPGLALPERVVAFGTTDAPSGGHSGP